MMRTANIQGSEVATVPRNMHSVAPGSSKGVTPQGEPNGEFTMHITIDNNRADSRIHVNLEFATFAATLGDTTSDPVMLREARSRLD